MTVQIKEQEKVLLNIVRNLPPNHANQLINFARFLEAQTLEEEWLKEANQYSFEEDDQKWDQLFQHEKSEMLLDKMTEEALEQYKQGKAKRMSISDEGRLTTE